MPQCLSKIAVELEVHSRAVVWARVPKRSCCRSICHGLQKGVAEAARGCRNLRKTHARLAGNIRLESKRCTCEFASARPSTRTFFDYGITDIHKTAGRAYPIGNPISGHGAPFCQNRPLGNPVSVDDILLGSAFLAPSSHSGRVDRKAN